MSGAPVGGGGDKGRKKKGKRKPKRRLNISIDMTPMVDVAFLLLTFFMLTTVFRKPQTLEINLPPSQKVNVEIAESNLLTIRVDKEQSIFWNIGIETPVKIVEKDFQKFLHEKYKENPKFVVLVKIDRSAKYKMMVNILDKLGVANLSRFSLAPMTDIDLKILAKAIS